ncbi:MAG: PAS domain-containing sensor histidine kinase [Bacteroidales bacterium]
MKKKTETEKNHFHENKEDLYKTLFENVHDGIYRTTVDGKILTANPALVAMLGYDSEEEVRKLNITLDIFVNATDRLNSIKALQSSGMLKNQEVELKRKDGEIITVLDNSHVIRDENGNIIFFEGSLINITKRKQAEKALRESENRYHTLLETLHDAVSLFDLNGKLIYFNRQKKVMLGYKSDREIMNVNTFDMIYPDDRMHVRKLMNELLSKGTITIRELRVLKKDGSFIWAEFSATIIKNDKGEPMYIMDTMRDITDRKKNEEQLKLLKHSVDVHYDGAFWLDTGNNIVYLNDTISKSTGYRKEELTGKHISYLSPMLTEDVLDLVWRKLRKGGSFTAESLHRRKDGSSYPVEMVSTYVKYGGREYNCAFTRDITERLKTDEEMKLRVEQLRQIIDLVPSYIFAKDSCGKFLLVNKAIAEVFGISPEEIIGKDDSDYGATREQVEWYRKNDLEVINKGVSVNIPEEQVLRKDGTLGWFQTVKIPYRHPGNPEPAILGVATEITERKLIEDSLRKSELRFRKLFEDHPAVKLIINPYDASIVDANRAASLYYGWSVSKLRTMNLADINTISSSNINERMQSILETSSMHFETIHRLADGSHRDVEIFAGIIDLEGKKFVHSVIHDITEKNKVLRDLVNARDKAEESDRLKTAFLHNISHEIRTPMNAIVGFTTLLDSPDLDEENKKQYIDIITQSSNQLLSIINDIVDISNIEIGHVKLYPRETNLYNLLQNLKEQYRLREKQTGNSFNIKPWKNKKDVVIITDETKLIQVLTNLINNSFKFTESGNIEAGYTVSDNMITFQVKDSGRGIKSEHLERIFERFYQGDESYHTKTEGIGLGLAISKAYVDMLGGKLEATSEPGKGSVFQFTIPVSC